MFHKCIPFRRQQRKNKIKRRMRIIKEVWRTKWLPEPGKFAKHHPGCSCWMCSKSSKTWYAGPKTSEKRKILRENDVEVE